MLVDELPKTATSKVAKNELRALVRDPASVLERLTWTHPETPALLVLAGRLHAPACNLPARTGWWSGEPKHLDGLGVGGYARRCRQGSDLMTTAPRAHDCLINVHFGDSDQPDWMFRVKDDYFKRDDWIFGKWELSKVIDEMDANGVQRAVVTANINNTTGSPFEFVNARPDRFV